uniref:Uncharacterized protein n=1 Tax=Kwoniella bestiolae CBS 10118 TaxID=1296100 RepID=A0A1B9GD51_9TREE|nr:hypothetical protein I302_00440 [Kwoniella bestiolae CBS 10118]OCF28949.1 hypothetical protein I302_00440 [Kwoniella bestiolae CBS 10118]
MASIINYGSTLSLVWIQPDAWKDDTIYLEPLPGWNPQSDIPKGIKFGSGPISVDTTACLRSSYQGHMNEVGKDTQTCITYDSHNIPSKESFVHASRLKNVLERNLKNLSASVLSLSAESKLDTNDPGQFAEITAVLAHEWSKKVLSKIVQVCAVCPDTQKTEWSFDPNFERFNENETGAAIALENIVYQQALQSLEDSSRITEIE